MFHNNTNKTQNNGDHIIHATGAYLWEARPHKNKKAFIGECMLMFYRRSTYVYLHVADLFAGQSKVSLADDALWVLCTYCATALDPLPGPSAAAGWWCTWRIKVLHKHPSSLSVPWSSLVPLVSLNRVDNKPHGQRWQSFHSFSRPSCVSSWPASQPASQPCSAFM